MGGVGVWVGMSVCPDALRGQKKASDLWELKLHAVMRPLKWGAGIWTGGALEEQQVLLSTVTL